MKYLAVVNALTDWTLDVPEIEVVTAKDYLKKEEYSKSASFRVLNLCRSHSYQKLGYYVSLLAMARGHKPLPSLTTLEDMKTASMIRFASEEFDDAIQKSLHHLHGEEFTLSMYFGKNVAKAYDRLAALFYQQFPCPYMQAKFQKIKEQWHLISLKPLSAKEMPADHTGFAAERTKDWLTNKHIPKVSEEVTRYDLAILVNSEEESPPSDKRALKSFEKAAEKLGLSVEFITKKDFGRIAEFDALFIRETTQVNHHTYRFARAAMANGIEVIDDPLSILRCCNKVFLYELLDRYKVPVPKTTIVDREALLHVAEKMEYPCVLKRPDSAFSQGVIKAKTKEEFLERSKEMLENSDLILAQEYLPTDFDWRIGVLDGKPLYCCRYQMVKNHWQIRRVVKGGKVLQGGSAAIPLDEAPPKLLKLAVKAAGLIGDGFYGVDIKQIKNRFFVMEINDNPSIDVGVEDAVLKDELYLKIIGSLVARIDRKNLRILKEKEHHYEGAHP